MVTYLGSLVQSFCGERGTLQTNIAGICGECLQCLGHTGFAPVHGVCAFPVYTAQALDCSAGNCLRQALGCMHSPGLSHSSSGSQVLHKGADLVGPAFVPIPGLSSSGDQVLGKHSHSQVGSVSYRLPHPSHSFFFLGVQQACLLRCAVCLFWGADLWLRPSWQMSTVQNPKKSWLAVEPVCSLVEDVSLGP